MKFYPYKKGGGGGGDKVLAIMRGVEGGRAHKVLG